MWKKPVISLLLFFSLLVFSNAEVLAAPRALLMVGGFTQWVELEYQYSGQKTETDTTFSRRQHYFQEEYNFQVNYAILNPRLWRGQFRAGVALDQDYYSSSNAPSRSSSGNSYQYNLTGAVLERSPLPLNFYSHSERIHAQREFSTPYDIDLDSYGLNLAVKNRHLPARLDYTRTTTETSGLGSDSIQTSETLTLKLSHQMRNRSDTEVQISFFDTSSEAKRTDRTAENKTSEATLRNQVRLSEFMLDRTLISRIQVREEERSRDADSDEITTLRLEEQLIWPFGRALTSGADYAFTERDFSSRGTDRYHNGRVWLQHRLFESLSTQLDGDYRKDDLATGTEENVSGALGLLYQKKLPQDSLLYLSFHQLYQLTDRDQNGVSQLVIDEPHTAVADPVIPGLVAPILLLNFNVVPESIVVINADPTVRLLPYVVNVDYGVQQIGLQTQIVILPGSDIAVGDNLLFTYANLNNPQVEYSTDTRRTGFNLLLFNNAYRLYGSWIDSQQDLISGREDDVRLVDQTAYKIGLEVNRAFWSFGGEYEDVDSDQDEHQTIMAFLRSSHRIGRGSLSLYASDAYTKTQANSFTGPDLPERTVNSFNAGGTYNTQLFGAAQMLFTAKYFNLSGDAISRDDVSLGLNVRWGYGKISFSLLSQVNWRMQPEVTTRDEYVRLNLTRYF